MIKHIKISEETHEKLTSMGKKGETYDDIISRLLEHYEYPMSNM